MAGKLTPDALVELLVKKEITHGEFSVYSVIRNLEKAEDKYCWASNAHIATLAKLNKDWVKSIVVLGIKRGFLIVNRPHIYKEKEYRSLSTIWNTQGGELQLSPLGTGLPTISYSSNKNTTNKNQSQAEPAQEKDNMPLIPNKNPTIKSVITPFDLACAKSLAEGLRKSNLLGKYSANKWAKEFHLLIHKDKISSDRIQKVLDYYVPVIARDRWVPQVLSGSAFRTKFIQLEQFVQRDKEKNPQIEITERAKKNCNWIDHMDWKKGSQKLLPIAMQLSIDNLLEFVSRLKMLIGNASKAKASVLKRTATNILNWVTAQGFDNFLVMYFRRICEKLHNWEKWDGDLLRFVLKPTSPLFTQLGRDEIQRSSGSSNNWDKLIKEMGYAE